MALYSAAVFIQLTFPFWLPQLYQPLALSAFNAFFVQSEIIRQPICADIGIEKIKARGDKSLLSAETIHFH